MIPTSHIRRSRVVQVCITLTIACGSGCSSDTHTVDDRAVDGLLVTLDDGRVQGDMSGDARRFLKIPFAKPPLGALRWKAPEPNEPWDGVRHETEFAEGCAQNADQGAPASSNEDCLYLNVWSPEPAPDHAPVMLWIHGGGNFSGAAGIPVPSSQQLWYDGQHFASRHGVVVVTIHYRLGPLGFMAHGALGDEGSPLGNQGLLDQRRALQWVHDNIAKFGGDADNVTIFGESAGSADVCYHVASPESWGLFHRAISQSGGCTLRSIGAEESAASVASSMEAFGASLGCPAGSEQLACMRGVPIETIMANAMQPSPGAASPSGPTDWNFAAVIDGADGFLPDRPQALFDRGEIADVPYLLGSNNDEGTLFVLRSPPLTTEAEYLADAETRYGTSAAQVVALYPATDFEGDLDAARAAAAGDVGLVCGTHDTARRAADAGRDVYLYNFKMDWTVLGGVLRAAHAAEISHVFGAPYLPTPDAESEAVGEAMNAYWARFAATGDPNGDGAPAAWPTFSSDNDRRLQLAPDWSTLENFRSEKCTFWREYAGNN